MLLVEQGGKRISGVETEQRGTERGTKAAERTETEKRDPPAKGSYYNKFVGDLRSGNNSELRVTLRMCLSLLLFKWEWKATSCAGCDLHLRLAFSASIPTYYLFSVFSRFCSPSSSSCRRDGKAFSKWKKCFCLRREIECGVFYGRWLSVAWKYYVWKVYREISVGFEESIFL